MTINITIMTGNGLDLTNKLKTSYIDFYENYVSKFKRTSNKIYNFLNTNMELWKDVEKSIARLDAMDYTSLAQFVEDKDQLQNDLGDYLSSIDDQIAVGTYDERRTNLLSFVNHVNENLLPADKIIFDDFLLTRRLSGRDDNKMNRIPTVVSRFLTFNYTHLLEKKLGYFQDKHSEETIGDFELLHGYKVLPIPEKIVHAHGSIDDSFIFGVNDSSQIAKGALKGVDRYLVKSDLQKMARSNNQNLSTEVLATQSDIIIVIGLSLGDTDKYWREMVVASLIYNPDSIVIVNKYVKDNRFLRSPAVIESIIRNVKNNFRNVLTSNPVLMGYLKEYRRNQKDLMNRILVAPYTDVTSNIGNLKFDIG
ncbi:AbiH family protein [Levilactobacillus tujiorum]|uniref:SIR2-like domain-containing protein n=1 Tax=Levilactobacillus tujiorum TaxID=2912243 RepID=A0ABX1L2Z9_9LACO|nr:AbiH family protein [Levilactobacillus tujiorum]MCH5463714.1 bacteriophage abortive infection AbiH family protein [Levilactobacillus tujiorum]NLR10921.1 hypothetical protein [Lactobacillus sp. HBUAS51387]NLR28701.1 hypothetical protein [Levilactobacillus tujiorum]